MSTIQHESSLSENIPAVEGGLKELLNKMLSYLENYITTQDDLKAIEGKLMDYDNLLALVEMINVIFDEIVSRIDRKAAPRENCDTEGGHYDQLEKVVQKYEGEIRNHIRVEQQLKLFSESLQTKLDESERTRIELLESTKAMISTLKRDNQNLAEKAKRIGEEKATLEGRRLELEQTVRNYEDRVIPSLQERLRAMERGGVGGNDPILKKINVELDSNKNSSVQYSTTIGSTQGHVHVSPLRVPAKRPATPYEAVGTSMEKENNSARPRSVLPQRIYATSGPRTSKDTGRVRETKAYVPTQTGAITNMNRSLVGQPGPIGQAAPTRTKGLQLHKRSRSTGNSGGGGKSRTREQYNLATIYNPETENVTIVKATKL
eukprot:TRINITY_DN7605_c0_g1_i6.p1 TRINITY_DN7605_c0_g1~~TRINITY_DN7605_c0_g1_i6.p1  ORF type:complete len:376 (+),score=90.38 TRINITY_DN7605_c0_g1_i6:35-1162(+)